jgi:membrane associated rhomboid family serine protease
VWHLFFNMLTLYIFGRVVEGALGLHMLTIYVGSGLAATLLIFLMRRGNPDYRVLGASGSVTGILFASIVINPHMSVFFLVLPIPIPAPVFALIYIAYSSFLLDREVGNVAHEAHIAGALTGFVLAGLLYPYHFAPLAERIHDLLH